MTDFIGKTHRQIITFNKDLGHSYTPNLNARLIDENGGYFIKTNSSGFRSNIEFKNKKEKKRILFFGDSNTAADGVSNNDRYSDILGKYFDAEVFNYAISGTGTDQQYLTWKKYAKEVQADLIIIGSLVENIERNKVQYRETIDYFTKKKTLTPKPYYEIENNNLKLKNCPVERFDGNFDNIDKKKTQWNIPLKEEGIYKAVNYIRKNNFFKYLDKKYENQLTILRSFLIKFFYQPYKDYEKPQSEGYKLSKKILENFIQEIKAKNIPVILAPIPTYHYYFDGAKPVYKNFFNSFNNPSENIFVMDPLQELKSVSGKNKRLLALINDKSHFSKNGHLVIANYLKKEINNLGILNLSKNSEKNYSLKKKIKKSIYILGISAFYHDSAATLIQDGKIISAAQEERFTRKKNDQSFPKFAINYCLEEAGISAEELDAIIYYDNAYLTLERTMWSYVRTAPRSLKSWMKYVPRWVSYKFFIPNLIRENLNYKGKILQNQHHRSHLASAFFPSPFSTSAILTVDGVGEWATASIGLGQGNKIKMLKEMSYPNSVGLLYSAFTQFLGFKVNSGEYKMMGLAPYGKPIYYDLILEKLIVLRDDGSIKINQEYFSYLDGSEMTNQKFADLFGGKARKPESRITQQEMNIASSIQKVTEKIIFNMASYAKKITGADNLCLSGGVALNCVINGSLLRSGLFKDIWVQPASGDAGSSLGSAYDAYFSYFKKDRILREDKLPFQKGSLLGPSWKNSEIESFLDSADINYNFIDNEKEKNNIVANYINEGKVIGLFLGRTEFGPRALGSRSIIGDPRNKEMQTRINLKIKFRESFRPFAPAILKDKVNDFFDLKKESPYMMMVAPVQPNKRVQSNSVKTDDMLQIVKEIRSEVPAITHIDYSARVQTVDQSYNKKFYQIIKEFENQSNCPLVINTSFNVRGEPIVNSPLDAFKCFMNTNMDILVIEDFIIEKEKQSENDIKKWKFIIDEEKTTKEKFYFSKELSEIYSNVKKIKVNDNISSKGWCNYIEESNSKIFEIPDELDKKNYQPSQMCDEIIEYWKDKKFANDMRGIILELLELSKKYKNKKIQMTEKISENMYEMF